MNQVILNTPQTLAYEPVDSEHILACGRIAVTKVIPILVGAGKMKWLDTLKTKAKFDCCRKPENLEIEAWFTNSREAATTIPDLYKFYCRICEEHHNAGENRGYCHVFFCIGSSSPAAKNHSIDERPDLYEVRPHWEVR